MKSNPCPWREVSRLTVDNVVCCTFRICSEEVLSLHTHIHSKYVRWWVGQLALLEISFHNVYVDQSITLDPYIETCIHINLPRASQGKCGAPKLCQPLRPCFCPADPWSPFERRKAIKNTPRNPSNRPRSQIQPCLLNWVLLSKYDITSICFYCKWNIFQAALIWKTWSTMKLILLKLQGIGGGCVVIGKSPSTVSGKSQSLVWNRGDAIQISFLSVFSDYWFIWLCCVLRHAGPLLCHAGILSCVMRIWLSSCGVQA